MAEPMRTQLRVRLERAALVGLVRPSREEEDRASYEELHLLAESAGAHLAGGLTQRREKPDPRTFLGRGKVEELGRMLEEAGVDLVIVNRELTPAQVKNLETALDVKVIDRTELILDIFASRARTRLARLQVELAQLEYSLPRLQRMWTHLSRIEGGIGMRGPGERQIEEDRRAARRRIGELRKKLEHIGLRRRRTVSARRGAFKVSLVGYTNAGKSTLLRRLTGARVRVQDRLFATLDTKTSAWKLPGGRKALLSDTVGFVRDLPHGLVASFHATLEETVHADLLLHVADASSRDLEGQMRSVEAVLEGIGADHTPVITVFNKMDAVADPVELASLEALYPRHVEVSALDGRGIDGLQSAVLAAMDRSHTAETFLVPHHRSDIAARLRRAGRVIDASYSERGATLRVVLPRAEAERVRTELAAAEGAGG